MRIVFTGGGSGGHFFPILAAAREIKRIAEEERILDVSLYYLGPERIPAAQAAGEDILFSRVAAGKLRRYFSLLNALDLFRLAWGMLEALGKMFLIMPDVVFAKGGYGSFPTLLAARLYRIPVIIHESDAVPGLVNRWAGRFAGRVAISFAESARHFPRGRTALTGVPIRKRLLGGTPEAAREALGVFSARPVILVLGGSQGARVLNETVTEILPQLLQRYELIHQVGEANLEDMRLDTAPLLEGGRRAYYHLAGFLDEEGMRDGLLLADLIVSRAGATAIFEIAAMAKPAILIPIKNAAQEHQRENAYAYASAGAAIVIEENNLTPSVLLNEIQNLMADPARRTRMGEAAKSFAKPEAAETIAREVLKLGLH